MRLSFAAFCILALAGCGGGVESQIVGRWHVDPTSIETPRLAEGASQTRDWTDAVAILAKVEVQFAKDGSVMAKGFDLGSSATWAVTGNSIKLKGGAELWPTMTFDPNTQHIHLLVVKGDDSLKMDLIKN